MTLEEQEVEQAEWWSSHHSLRNVRICESLKGKKSCDGQEFDSAVGYLPSNLNGLDMTQKILHIHNRKVIVKNL